MIVAFTVVTLVDKDYVIADDVIHCANYDDQVRGPLILKRNWIRLNCNIHEVLLERNIYKGTKEVL